MKIAFCSQIYDGVLPPRQNSVGIWTYEVARRLSENHRVAVIARRTRGAPSRVLCGNVEVELVNCAPARAWAAIERLRRRLWPRAGPQFAQPFYVCDYVFQSIRRLRSFDPDLIHVQNFPAHLPAYRRAFPKAALVLHMHCDWLVQLDEESMRRSLMAADLVVGCSSHVAEQARKRFENLPVRIAVLPNATRVIDRPQRPAEERREIVLFVGRVSPEKGVHVLLEAWPEIRAARPQARLEIVGPVAALPRDRLIDLSNDPEVRLLSQFYSERRSEERSYLQRLRDMIPLALADSVQFIGFEPYDRVLKRYASAALLVNPSFSEAFGMSVIEALAAGTPVVATRVGGMPEILEKTSGGVLAEKNNSKSLAAAIIDLLSNPQARADLGARGSEGVAALYSWQRVADMTCSLHCQAVRDHGGDCACVRTDSRDL